VVSVWAGTDTLEVYDPDHRAQNATEPMKLRNAVEVKRNPDGTVVTPAVYGRVGPNFLPDDEAHVRSRKNGRYVWLNNCAICHSSKQPAKFALRFSRDWQKAPVPGPGSDPVYTLPMDFKDWEDFRKSPAMNDYRERLFARVRKEARDATPVDAAAVSKALEEGNFLRAAELRGGALLKEQDPAKEDHPFWKDNFLSTDIRIPVTLVGTNAARALGTNAVRGHMWADFSSDTYKDLASVGKIPYYDPFSDKAPDEFWNNAEFDAPGGGVGYYRPATHISLWATAPFLHNNTLGLFNNDPSVRGRVAAFEDAMNKMLTRSERGKHSLPGAKDVPMGAVRIGDLRAEGSTTVQRARTSAPGQIDPGFIYRTPRETRLQIGPSFVRPLVAGVAGKGATNVLSLWLWVVLVPVFVLLAWKARARHAGFVLLTLAALLAALLVFTGIGGFGAGGVFSVIPVILMALSNVLSFSHKAWWLLVLALALLGWGLLHAKPVPKTFKRWRILVAVGSVALLLCLAVGIFNAGEVAGYLVRGVAYLQHAGFFLRLIAGLVITAAFLIAWVRYGGEGISRLIYTAFAIVALLVGFVAHQFIEGKLVVRGVTVGVDVGPLPRGMPVNFLMSMDPQSPHGPQAIVSMFYGMTEIKRRRLEGDAAWKVFAEHAGPALIKASKCPDYVLDRGHWFGEHIDAAHKADLIEFLKTL
jgi:hypothetical protein